MRLGFTNFGGPAGQIAIMHRDLVMRRRWISEERFLHALNFCMLLPGPEATQLAIYIGWLLHRAPGGIVAGVFFVLPSMFILLGLSVLYASFGTIPGVSAVLGGLKPVVVAIVVEALWRIGGRTLRRPALVAIAAGAFLGIFILKIPFPWIVLGAGLLGLAGSRFRPATFSAPSPAEGSDAPPPESVLSDAAPPAPHTLPSRRRTRAVLVAGILLWVIPLAVLTLTLGWHGLHAREYRFFTQAALVTFGGAYAVLAYVSQAAVETFQWLTHPQAVDGLALAETTPGPLIMVLQFVGFMAGWNRGPDALTPLASGVLGGLVTTWATFLPCFLFIFLGAPYIEVLRGNRALAAALTGITAAVVGVIANLAVVFGSAVLFPGGPGGAPDVVSIVIAAAAFIVLIRWHPAIPWVVLAGALAGALRALARLP